MTCVAIPFWKFCVAGSLPVLVAKYDASFKAISLPLMKTDVEPLAKSLANAVFG